MKVGAKGEGKGGWAEHHAGKEQARQCLSPVAGRELSPTLLCDPP